MAIGLQPDSPEILAITPSCKNSFTGSENGCHDEIGAMEILWGVVLFAVTILIGLAWELMRRHQYSGARICFWSGAIILAAWNVVWAMQTDSPLVLRIGVSAIVGALALVGLSESLRWVTSEAKSQPPGESFPMSDKLPPQTPPSGGVNQYNQGAPNLNVPGSGNQFFFLQQPPAPVNSQNDSSHIWQDGTRKLRKSGLIRNPW